ncbi:MAG: RNA polymerase sigma factor [Myxococcales bacterium]|nr:RNA polymerase sigma factor [Myxococcales bacterium]
MISSFKERPHAPEPHDVTDGGKAGDAFDAFYAQWVSKVFAWLRAQGVRPAELDDVAQDVFLVVHRRLPRFDGRHPAAWLYRVAHNVVRNHRRAAWLKRLVFMDTSDPELPFVDERTTSAAHEEAERLRALQVLLDRMEPKRRAALWMFEVEGASGEEIAEVQGVPLNTVWSRLRLARQDLAKLVESARQAQQGGEWP